MQEEIKVPPARIRALFVDLDGTLVDGSERISPGVQRALDAAQARDCTIIVCTGRTRYTAMPIVQQATHLHGYAVVSNGGVVLHLETREVLLRRVMSIPLALDIIRAIVEAGASPYVYEDALSDSIEESRVLYHPKLPLGDWATPPRYRPHPTLMDDLPFTPVSVSTFGPPRFMKTLVPQLRERLPDTVSAIESGGAHNWGVEIYTRGVSKRLGVETVTARLGLTREEVMAIGNHRNDLDMLEWAGIGVAMGNALPEVKAVADWTTASVAEDGVAQAIARFIL